MNSMQRLRITANPIPDDPLAEKRRLSSVRRDLYIHLHVVVDPDNPAYETRRDNGGPAYFEFSTSCRDEVDRVLQEYGHDAQVTVDKVAGPVGEPCMKCGHISGETPQAVCPQCGLREISPCPFCEQDVSRHEYDQVSSDLHRCARCKNLVYLRFNEPVFCQDGEYNQPVVIVDKALDQPA